MATSEPDTPGIGIDIVSMSQFSAFLARHQDDLGEVFTEEELAGAGRGGAREVYLATRWALKEATFKALGTGWGRDLQWTDVEAVSDVSRPSMRLRGAARRLANAQGPCRAVASAASSCDCVIAMVVLVRKRCPAGAQSCDSIS